MRRIYDSVRLNAYLARAGSRLPARRRRADQGRPRDASTASPASSTRSSSRGDRVEVDGEPVATQQLAYVLLHKPAGVVTTARDPQGRPTVVELVDAPERGSSRSAGSTPTRPARSCSRTTATLAHRLAHPRYEVEKVYEAEVEGEPDRRARSRASPTGVELDDGPTAPAQARRLGAARSS